MRAFSCSLVALVLIAVVASFTLNLFQTTAAQNMTTGSARLDHQEYVNLIGREG
jgi:hypothetical protein